MTNPDRLLHVFSTFLGMTPDSNDAPVCGATLTSDYNGRDAARCPQCAAILDASLQALHVARPVTRRRTRDVVRDV